MNAEEFASCLRRENIEVLERYQALCEGSMCLHTRLKVKYEGCFGFPAALIDTCVTLPDGITYKWWIIQDRAHKRGETIGTPSEMRNAVTVQPTLPSSSPPPARPVENKKRKISAVSFLKMKQRRHSL
jgi:hypothetical protein